MTDEANEKVQFLLATLRARNWAYALATWSNNALTVILPGDRKAVIDLTDTSWEGLSPTEKLAAAAEKVVEAEKALQEEGFDPIPRSDT